LNLQWLMGPFLGGFIGYLTNDLAIRMLFRPRKAVFLFGHRLPFTPGLIPKERDRLASSIAQVVGQELFSAQSLTAAMTSHEIREAVRLAPVQWAKAHEADERTLGSILEKIPEAIAWEEKARNALACLLSERIRAYPIGETAARAAVKAIRERTQGTFLSLFVQEDSLLLRKAELSVQSMVDQWLNEEMDGYLNRMIASQEAYLLNRTVGEIVRSRMDDLPRVQDLLERAYLDAVQRQLPGWLQTLDLERFVREKIGALSSEELEILILRVMKKELRAIVWLGALLGAILGSFSLLY